MSSISLTREHGMIPFIVINAAHTDDRGLFVKGVRIDNGLAWEGYFARWGEPTYVTGEKKILERDAQIPLIINGALHILYGPDYVFPIYSYACSTLALYAAVPAIIRKDATGLQDALKYLDNKSLIQLNEAARFLLTTLRAVSIKLEIDAL